MQASAGSSSPVIVPAQIDWERDYSLTTVADLVGMREDELAAIDPVAMNLIVAKGLPSLAHLDIRHYQTLVDGWVLDLNRRCFPHWEPYFHQAPQDFNNDIRYFRLGAVSQYLELEVGIAYHRDQRELNSILYTNPSDLFLNGVLDSHEGTCGNMSALQVAMGWRMGWPVSLACVNSHYVLRFDDGETTYNIEATQSGYGGFKSDPDEYLIREKNLPRIGISCGSDLRALRPRELLGVFVSLRARHLQDVGKYEGSEAGILASEADWLLARQLFPSNRAIYKNQMVVATLRGEELFDSSEPGHPNTYSACLGEIRRRRANGWALGQRAPRANEPRLRRLTISFLNWR